MLPSRSVCFSLRALCCALSMVVFSAQLTAANFVFEFELSSVDTRGNCAGDDLSIGCETYLSTFCLRLQSETDGCSLGSSGRYGPGGGLPITRRISSTSPWPVSFQLYIKARDEDKPIGRDDDLDDIYINRSRQPNPGYSQVADYLGNNGKVSVRLRYRISCQTNYYGTNCATSCVARNDDVNGHYTCNSDGSIRCRDGYENPSNNCRDRITACSRSPCAQDAPCTPIGLSDYSCDCPPGFTGKSCESEINECDPNPCQNNATCSDHIADYTCQCPAGYSGKNCSVDIDDCTGVECTGNSTCIDGVDSFTCVCNHGFEGEDCTEINPCDSSPCASNGSCTPMGPFDYTCECAAGYSGPTCEVDIDECLTAVCPANSECVDAVNSYVCVCNPGFGGDQRTPIAMNEQGATDQTRLVKQNVMAIIIGAAIGGLVIVLIIVVIIIILICICHRGRTKQLSYDLPGELLTTSSTFTRADSHVYQSTEDVKEDYFVTPNPLYNSPLHQNVVSSPAEPYYSYVSSTTSPDHSSTLHVVPNPIYGTQSPPPTADGVYSVPMVVTPTKKDLNAAEEHPYSYARVETSRLSLKDSSGTVIKKDQPAPPPYEYISMAPAEAATPERSGKEPTVTLSVGSGGGNGHTKVTFKRSIYDDDFQYEIVNISGAAPVEVSNYHTPSGDPSVQPSPAPQLKPVSIPQGSHYDVPRSSGDGPPGTTPAELSPTYGNIPAPPPYDKLNHGTDFTQPTNSVRLGKVEGSGYGFLNNNS